MTAARRRHRRRATGTRIGLRPAVCGHTCSRTARPRPPTREASSMLNTIIIVLVVVILALIAWRLLTSRRV
jgi:hypothetical protein